MLPITFAPTPRALLRGARSLVVIAPARTLSKARFPKKVLDKKLGDMVLELARDVAPGLSGASASTLVSTGAKAKGPRWLTLGVLPNEVSRYNAPSRAESIRKVVSSLAVPATGKFAVLVLLDDPTHLLAAANAIARAIPRFSAKGKPSKARIEIAALTTGGDPIVADETVVATVECSRDSAELVDTPPTDLDPESFAKRARELLTAKGIKLTEIKGAKLLEKGLAGIHTVGRAAVSAPRLLMAEYAGNGQDGGVHIALVGKGVTYDTGGLHLKARGSMETMKGDMGGAAAVLGAFRVLTRTGSPHRITLLLCLAENAIDARAYKPDDIIPMHSGKTVEINNTDAEGRLLLADGVSWAARELSADVVIDAATLTGAQLVSTGQVHAAIVSNDAELEKLVVDAGRSSGDLGHPLPFAPELYQAEFKSPIADMRNSVANRMNAQSSCAAQFIYSHLQSAPGAKQRKWCHIDLAGPSFRRDRGTGYGVALISEAVRGL